MPQEPSCRPFRAGLGVPQLLPAPSPGLIWVMGWAGRQADPSAAPPPPAHPTHPSAIPAAAYPTFSRVSPGCAPMGALLLTLTGHGRGRGSPLGLGKGLGCPTPSCSACGREPGQRPPCPLSFLAGEEPAYSQPLVCV